MPFSKLVLVAFLALVLLTILFFFGGGLSGDESATAAVSSSPSGEVTSPIIAAPEDSPAPRVPAAKASELRPAATHATRSPDTTIEPGRTDGPSQLDSRPRMTFVVVDDISGAPIEHFHLRTEEKGDPTRWMPANEPIVFEDHPKGEVVRAIDVAQQVWVIAPEHEPLRTEVGPDPGASDRQTLRLKAGGAIIGRVQLPDGSAATVAIRIQRALLLVNAWDPNPNRMHDGTVYGGSARNYDLDSWLGQSRSVQGADDGTFRIDGLAPGTYEMEIRAPQCAPHYFGKLRVVAGGVLDLGTIGLEPAARIRGVIVLAPTASPVGLKVVCDYAYADARTIPTVDGLFEFPALAAGEHILRIEAHPPELVEAEVRHVTLASGETQEVVIDLTGSAPCLLKIHVTRSGVPFAGAMVDAHLTTSEMQRRSTGLGTTDAAGLVMARVKTDPDLTIVVHTDNDFALGVASGLALQPGGDREISIDVVVGELVLVLPEQLSLPDQGTVTVEMTLRGSPAESEERIKLATPNSRYAYQGTRRWVGPRSNLGLVAAGVYDVKVMALREDGGRGTKLLGPIDMPLTVRADAMNELVVNP